MTAVAQVTQKVSTCSTLTRLLGSLQPKAVLVARQTVWSRDWVWRLAQGAASFCCGLAGRCALLIRGRHGCRHGFRETHAEHDPSALLPRGVRLAVELPSRRPSRKPMPSERCVEATERREGSMFLDERNVRLQCAALCSDCSVSMGHRRRRK
jgi:hypothetical protein